MTSTNQHAVAAEPEDNGANFWLVWGATGASNLGDGLYQFMLPVLALQLTSSPGVVAGVTVLLTAAWFVFALPAGSLVDRLDRRALLVWVTAARMALLALLTGALLMHQASIPLLYAVALLLGVGETLVDTALTAILPAVVRGERLTAANARITATQTVTNTFLGPPLAGALATLGMSLASAVSVVFYACAAAFLLLMRGTFRTTSRGHGADRIGVRAHLLEGMRFVWQHRLIRDLTLFTAAMNVCWASFLALFVVYAVAPGPLGLDPFGYSVLLTMLAGGGLAGSLLCERISRILGTRRALVIDMLGTILLVGVPVVTTEPLLIGAAMFCASAGASVWVILVASLRQRLVPAELLGRVYSASRTLSWGVNPVSALLAGLAAGIWGVPAVFTAATVWALVVLLAFVFWSTRASASL